MILSNRSNGILTEEVSLTDIQFEFIDILNEQTGYTTMIYEADLLSALIQKGNTSLEPLYEGKLGDIMKNMKDNGMKVIQKIIDFIKAAINTIKGWLGAKRTFDGDDTALVNKATFKNWVGDNHMYHDYDFGVIQEIGTKINIGEIINTIENTVNDFVNVRSEDDFNKLTPQYDKCKQTISDFKKDITDIIGKFELSRLSKKQEEKTIASSITAIIKGKALPIKEPKKIYVELSTGAKPEITEMLKAIEPLKTRAERLLGLRKKLASSMDYEKVKQFTSASMYMEATTKLDGYINIAGMLIFNLSTAMMTAGREYEHDVNNIPNIILSFAKQELNIKDGDGSDLANSNEFARFRSTVADKDWRLAVITIKDLLVIHEKRDIDSLVRHMISNGFKWAPYDDRDDEKNMPDTKDTFDTLAVGFVYNPSKERYDELARISAKVFKKKKA